MKVYALYDIKSKAYAIPVFLENDIIAQRSVIGTVLADRDGNLTNFQDDYELYCLGEYDDEHGTIVPPAKSLGRVIDIMQAYNNELVRHRAELPPEEAKKDA